MRQVRGMPALTGAFHCCAHSGDHERHVPEILANHVEALEPSTSEAVLPPDVDPMAAPRAVLSAVELADDRKLVAHEVRLPDECAVGVRNRPVAEGCRQRGIEHPDTRRT
jgi:hypothetical protein